MERNYNGEPGLQWGAEQREGIRIASVVIPADEEEPLREHHLPPSSLRERQDLVGGDIEGITLDEPAVRLLMNEDGKLLRLPINRRATLLAWMHNKAMRYGDVIAGDVVVLGYPDEDDVDTSVPDELMTRLLGENRLRVETQLRGETGWATPRSTPFNNWVDAYDYALRLGFEHHQSIADVRVVPEESEA